MDQTLIEGHNLSKAEGRCQLSVLHEPQQHVQPADDFQGSATDTKVNGKYPADCRDPILV